MSYSGWSNEEYHSIYENGSWQNSKFCPNIKPISSAVQYAQSVIEGMKAYKNDKGEIFIFRVEDHHKRLNLSLQKLNLPTIDFDFFYNALKTVVSPLSQWSFPIESNILYIRPVVYGLEGEIFPAASSTYGFSIYTAPIGDFRKESCTIRFYDTITRTSQNGLSSAKTALSYSPIISKPLSKNTFTDIWFDPISGCIEEADTANIFFVVDEKTIVTPFLNNKILAGITRDSVIKIINHYTDYTVIERDIAVNEVIELVKTKKLQDCFTTSTGIGIQKVNEIYHKNEFHTIHNTESLVENLKLLYENTIIGKDNQFKNWKQIL